MAFNVTPEFLIQGAADSMSTAGEIDEELNRLKTYMYNLLDEYTGVTSRNLEMLMLDFDRRGQYIRLALESMANGLKSNVNNYTGGEITNNTNIVEIANQLPPLRL